MPSTLTRSAPADARRRLRDAVVRSRRLARRGRLVPAVDNLRLAWHRTPHEDRASGAAARAIALRAEHAFLVGDTGTARSVLTRSWPFLRDRRTTVVDAHMAIAITRLDAALRASGVPTPAELDDAPRLDLVEDEVIPGIGSRGLARCLLARAELRVDARDAAGALEDAQRAAQLWSGRPRHTVDLAYARLAEGEARGLRGDRELASAHLNAALQVFVEQKLHLAAAETRHALADLELRSSPGAAEDGNDVATDFIATLIYLHSLRLTFPLEDQRVRWARHIVEPALSLALEFAVARSDAVLVADLIAATRSVGVPSVRSSLASRGAYRLPVMPLDEVGADIGEPIDRVRTNPDFDLGREPAPQITMPGGRIALAPYLRRAQQLYPDLRARRRYAEPR